jgi:squalene-hopene/tetraprenyl-beta-curcumene cyclase
MAEQWILEHQEPTGDWGGIQPAMLNAILALALPGLPPHDHPAIVKGLEALANFCIEDEESLVLQSCVSPVWDTALAGGQAGGRSTHRPSGTGQGRTMAA